MDREPQSGGHARAGGPDLRHAEHELLEIAADNDYTTGIVPQEKRRSKLTMSLLWISLQTSVSLMYAGYLARSEGLTLGDMILAGVIGGGPTFLGTLLGTSVTSAYVFVAFLALAAGAILYVLGELFAAGRKLSWEISLWGILLGFLVGLATDMILVGAGV